MKLHHLLILTMLLGGLIACSTDKVCSDTSPSPGLVVEFYKDTLNRQTNKLDTFKYTLPDTLTVRTIPYDSIIFKPKVNSQREILPMSITESTSTFAFIIKTKASPTNPSVITRDTVKAQYELSREFVSQECGFRQVYLNFAVSVSKHRFKNFSQQQKDIVNEATTTLRIYF